MAPLGRKEKMPLGIYIHVPFCRSKCQYCDFYSLCDKDDKLMDGYLDAVCDHIRETGPQAPGYVVDTIYFGGGTPTFLGAEGLSAMLSMVRKHFDVAPNAEITFEANPDSISPRLLKKLHSEGFNRVSLGVQCDDDEILQKIGRPHDYEQAVSAVQKIRKAGFKNLSLDLIYGLPGQTMDGWMKTLANVLELKPEHISCYGLKVEEGTPLYACREFANLPDDDTQADMYLAAVEYLRSKGYRQYEISNFCRRNNESRHNNKYWNGGEYLGFGPDASSDFAGKRFKIVRDLRSYIDGMRGNGQVLEDVQDVPKRERAGEYLMLRLRTCRGICATEYENKFLMSFAPIKKVLEAYSKQGLAACYDTQWWRLTTEGFLLSNTIISDLLLAQERARPIAKRR